MSSFNPVIPVAHRVDVQPPSPDAPCEVRSVREVNISPYVIDSLPVDEIITTNTQDWFLFVGYMVRDGSRRHSDAQFGMTGKANIGQSNVIGARVELSEEIGHTLRRGEMLTFERQGIYHGSSLTCYTVSAMQLRPGQYVSYSSAGDDHRRRMMVIVHGSEQEMLRLARNAATELQRTGRNPDNIGYFYVISHAMTMQVIRAQPDGTYGGIISI
jgi:hypothetical protein